MNALTEMAMEHFSLEGMWWLPTSPDRRVPGRLRFDDDGVVLVLTEPLRAFVVPEDQVVGVKIEEVAESVLHGRCNSEDFTLFDVNGIILKGPFDSTSETYRVALALKGIHALRNAFVSAHVDFDHLAGWLDPESLVKNFDDRSVVIDRAWQEHLSIRHSDASVRLVSGTSSEFGPVSAVVRRTVRFVIETETPLTLHSLMATFVQPLQDLLALTLGRSVRVSALDLCPADAPDGLAPVPAYMELVQGRIQTAAAWNDVRSHAAPTILTPSDTSDLGDLVARWFDVRERHQDAVVLLLSPLYAPFIYGEHSFASVFQSAEALHSDLCPGGELSREAHKARVAAVHEALESRVDEPTFEWAVRVLTSRNDKRLADRIVELVKRQGAVGEQILNADPEFGSITSSARSGVSHGGARRRLDAIGRYWYGRGLSWVVRTELLGLAISDAEKAQRLAARRPHFHRTVDEIRARAEERSVPPLDGTVAPE